MTNYYKTFSNLKETVLVNEVFTKGGIPDLSHEKKVRETINIFFDNGYDKIVDDTLDELRNY